MITNAKKNSNITHYQERPRCLTGQGAGNVLLSVKAPNNPRFLIINAYNAPQRSINLGAGVSRLISLADFSFPTQTILAGDLNLHNPMWHPSYRGSPSPQSGAFIHWLELRDLSLISEIDRPTHNCGNVLDLCFGSSQLVARGTIATVREDLDVTSDHLPLLANIYCGVHGAAHTSGLRFAIMTKTSSYRFYVPN